MNLTFRKKFTANSRNLLRDCSYIEIFDRKTGKFSFSRKLREDHYPRYHLYVTKEEPGLLQLNLHLDMKKAIYEGVSAHSGEYEGPLIDQEAARIKGILESLTAENRPPPSEEKKSMLGWLFGKGNNED